MADCNGAKVMIDWIRDNVMVWRTPCHRCNHRRSEFLDGMCIDCSFTVCEERVRKTIHQWFLDHLESIT